MPVPSSTPMRQIRNAPNTRAATGVPPVPPEDSPKADLAKARSGFKGKSNGTAGKRMDVRQAITDRIIGILEQGTQVFRARWTQAASRGLPRNGKTGAPYHGVNVLLLWDEAIAQGYASNVWLTYKQAASLGAQVRKGERGVLCAHFERREPRGCQDDDSRRTPSNDERNDERTEENDRPADHGVLLCRPFWVFNVAQIDGLPGELVDKCSAPPTAAHGPVEAALRLVGGCNAIVRHGFERAMYLPGLDEIRLPWPRRFTSPECYCATLLHELVHFSGHPSRLHRAFGTRFGDDAYAFEELVAELGSAFVMGHCGLVDATIEGHAAYLQAWLRMLRNDRTAIFTAARLAGEAFEFILAREMPALDLVAPLPAADDEQPSVIDTAGGAS